MYIYREHLAAYRQDAAELVLLHGWASDSSIWRPLLATLRRHFHVTLIDLPGFGRSGAVADMSDPDQLIDAILSVLPSSAIYCGWSLGGMLATRLAARCPDRVQALICMASNVTFTVRPDWSAAMPRDDFIQFADLVARNPKAGLRRFQLLQLHGDSHSDSLRTSLDQLAPILQLEHLSTGLKCLDALDNRHSLAELNCPCLYLFGEKDALVPVAAAKMFADAYPQHRCQLMEGRGHITFLRQCHQFGELLTAFCREQDLVLADCKAQINKSDVGRSFSLAAESYNAAALLQHRVADHLLTYMPADIDGSVLDLGCGTGYSLPALKSLASGECVLALDLAPGMLFYAEQHCGESANYYLCGDAEDMPLADDSVAHIFSSLALQWCENLPALMFEIERVLQPGGTAVIATLGPDTLHELRSAWAEVDGYVHVNRFSKRSDLDHAIRQSGLELLAWDEVAEVMYYERLSELTRELKNIGASNVNGGRPSGLTGRQRLQSLTDHYEVFRSKDQKLPASYQLWYIRLCKPV
jgi:malonyl-CoA O-methyltransferase